MVDWMVEVRPEAEDFDWRTSEDRQPAVVPLVFTLFRSVGILEQILFLHKTKSVISSLERVGVGGGGGSALSQHGRAARLGIKLFIIQITFKHSSLHSQSPSSHHYPGNSVFGFILGGWRAFPGPAAIQQYDRSIWSLRGHPDRLQLPCRPSSHLAASCSGPVQLHQTARPSVLRGADPGRVASRTRVA